MWTVRIMVALLTMLFTLRMAHTSDLAGLLSSKRGKKVHMSFWRNWAVSIGGLVVFPVANAIFVPYLPNPILYPWRYCLGAVIGYVIGRMAFPFWFKEGSNELPERAPNKGSFLYWEGGRPDHWIKTVTIPGWQLRGAMEISSALLVVYILSPMPHWVVISLGLIFFAHASLVIMQSDIIQSNFRWGNAMGLWAVVIFITYFKLMWL